MTQKVIHRLSVYRRGLAAVQARDPRRTHVFSHEIAALSGLGAAQVRRDLMTIGFTGSPARGYEIAALVTAIGCVLDHPDGLRVALAGVGNLGRAMLAYFLVRNPHISIVAAFDDDPEKTGRVLHGCRCHAVADLGAVCAGEGVQVGLIAVPAGAAQAVADAFVAAGVRSLVNFAPAPLRVPPGVAVQDIDITTTVEKAGYYARHGAGAPPGPAREEESAA